MRITIIVILVAAAIYAIAAGLGLIHVKAWFGKRGLTKKTTMIADFEDPDTDFDWFTGGYAKMEQANQNQTHGKHSAKVTFYTQGQFQVMATPQVEADMTPQTTISALVVPSPQVKVAASTPQIQDSPTPQVPAAPVSEGTWQPQIVLDTHSVTKLAVFDWQEYTSLKLDGFNPQDKPVTCHLKIADARSFVYEKSDVLTPKKVTNISVSLDDLAQARMDLSSIRSIQFWVDVAGATQPVSVYLDNLRLEFDPGEVKKK